MDANSFGLSMPAPLRIGNAMATNGRPRVHMFGDPNAPSFSDNFRQDAPTSAQQDIQPLAQIPQNTSPSITDRYAYLRRLASSSEGIVGLAQHISTIQPRVMKIVRHRNRPLREARALQLAGPHRNLIKMFEVEYNPSGEGIMVLEYCKGGDLHSQIRHFAITNVQAPEEVVLHAMAQIAEALAFIHGGWTKGRSDICWRVTDVNHTHIVHGDIKPENILIRPPHFGNGLPDFVLADFGQAFKKDVEVSTGGGTNGFRAPEYYFAHKPPLTAKADVYAYGITMLHLCQGHRAPLFGCGQPPGEVRVPQYLHGSGAESFLRECLQFEPNDRLDMAPQNALMYANFFRNRVEVLSKNAFYPYDMWASL